MKKLFFIMGIVMMFMLASTVADVDDVLKEAQGIEKSADFIYNDVLGEANTQVGNIPVTTGQISLEGRLNNLGIAVEETPEPEEVEEEIEEPQDTTTAAGEPKKTNWLMITILVAFALVAGGYGVKRYSNRGRKLSTILKKEENAVSKVSKEEHRTINRILIFINIYNKTYKRRQELVENNFDVTKKIYEVKVIDDNILFRLNKKFTVSEKKNLIPYLTKLRNYQRDGKENLAIQDMKKENLKQWGVNIDSQDNTDIVIIFNAIKDGKITVKDIKDTLDGKGSKAKVLKILEELEDKNKELLELNLDELRVCIKEKEDLQKLKKLMEAEEMTEHKFIQKMEKLNKESRVHLDVELGKETEDILNNLIKKGKGMKDQIFSTIFEKNSELLFRSTAKALTEQNQQIELERKELDSGSNTNVKGVALEIRRLFGSEKRMIGQLQHESILHKTAIEKLYFIENIIEQEQKAAKNIQPQLNNVEAATEKIKLAR